MSAILARLTPVVLLLVSTASIARAQVGDAVFGFSTTVLGARNYDGAIYEAQADVGLSRHVRLKPGVRHLERTFDGGAHFGETTGVLGLNQNFGGGYYVSHEVSGTPNAVIAPEWTFNTQPHYAFGANDIGLNLGYSRFSNLKAGLIGASYSRDVGHDFSVMFASAFSRSDRWLIASHAHAIYKPSDRIEGRLVVAGGETLEAAGLAARFTSVTLDSMFRVSARVRAGLGLTTYESTLRSENSALLRLEVR